MCVGAIIFGLYRPSNVTVIKVKYRKGVVNFDNTGFYLHFITFIFFYLHFITVII